MVDEANTLEQVDNGWCIWGREKQLVDRHPHNKCIQQSRASAEAAAIE